MPQTIPVDVRDLFKKRAFGHLATIMPDGSPQVTPLWVDYDGKYLVINSALGRQKDCNMRRDGRVAIEIQDPDNPYRYMSIRGRVVEITEEGADETIDQLSIKYLGEIFKMRRPGEVRITYRIEPEHVTTSGG
jgi:PPOX class probable F420-dependent enzyme